MGDLVRCRDRSNKLIVLTDTAWTNILAHRPELRGQEQIVRDAVANPHIVTQDRDDPSWWFYYMDSPLPAPFNNCFVRVSVEFVRKGALRSLTGLVRMVELVKGYRAREVWRWPPLG